jgi:hypothetical protein
MLPTIDVGTKFLLQLGNVKGYEVHMENSFIIVLGKLFYKLTMEWTALNKQKSVIIDVLPNQNWLKILSNTRTLGLTSNDFSQVVTVDGIPTDALEMALSFAQIYPRRFEG